MSTHDSDLGGLSIEKESIQSIFCLPGECVIEGSSVTLNFGLETNYQGRKREVKVILHPVANYPNSLPDISIISSDITKNLVDHVKSKARNHCSSLLGEPMLVSLALFIQECLTESCNADDDDDRKITEFSSCKHLENENNESVWTSILLIDHMRSKTKYCKTLEKWSKELLLCGHIVFYNRLILVILQGDLHGIKDFVVRLKTTSVDVDSRGHSCKEKMMKVLCEQQQHQSHKLTRFESFTTVEVADTAELKKLFENAGLVDLFEEYVAIVESYVEKWWREYAMWYGAEGGVINEYWNIIKNRYTEKHRHYHTLRHIAEMLGLFEQVKTQLTSPALVGLAILFHDVIYEPTQKDNEEQSGQLFKQFSSVVLGAESQEVYDWILQTQTHVTDVTMVAGHHVDNDGHFLLDLDMAILAASDLRYREYTGQIRQEYSHLSDEEFTTGRSQVLRKFLKRVNIYNTKLFQSKCEARARKNITAEIERLEQMISNTKKS